MSDSKSQRKWWQAIGPGIITGASDDDPGGIATYSQAGAAFGYTLAWVMPFTLPFVFGIQEICARVGRVTGHGIAGNLRRYHSRTFLFGIVMLLLTANIFNIGADLIAMGDAAALVLGGSSFYYSLAFAGLSLALQVLIPYHRYVAYLRWLTLSLLAYVIAAFVIDVPWFTVARSVFIPKLNFDREMFTTILALLGTTISPYLFFWQASEEVEEEEIDPNQHPLLEDAAEAPSQFKRIEIDTLSGMTISCLVAFFIMVTVSATLHQNGITDVKTSAEAAQALRPIAGDFAFVIFSLGVIGTGLLALPVLAGSAAYAVGEAIGCVVGLERKPADAKLFYLILSLAMLCGLMQVVFGLPPMKALFWSAVVNGVIAAPLLVVILRLASEPKIMGQFVIPRHLRILGWLGAIVMSLITLGLVVL